MQPTIKSKLPNTGTTIFTVMSQLALEHSAINLGQGFPDITMNEQLIENVSIAMKTGNNQYSHTNGLPLLRELIATKAKDLYNATINADTDITITPGATYAIYTALTTILQAGDEVIIFEPAFDSYIPNIETNGAVVVPIPLVFPTYTIDWELVRKKITVKTKAIIINSPHNPTGSVLNKADIEELRATVKNTGIFIISDEVYEHIMFDNLQHESILKYPDLFERSFVCFSFGKTYSCTGWKMGYCIAPGLLMKEYRKIHQYNCFCCNHPLQHGLAMFMNNKSVYLELGKSIQQKRDFFKQAMSKTRLKPLPCSGGYFQLYSFSNVTNESEKNLTVRLTKEYGVTAIPVSAFYKDETDNKVLRFCFVKKEGTLAEAANRLQSL